MQPPENDPYRAMWQMSQVGGAGPRGGRRIRWVAGIVGGLVAFAPFALVTAILWGFFADGEVEFTAAGFALLLVGLAAGLSLGGYLATSDD